MTRTTSWEHFFRNRYDPMGAFVQLDMIAMAVGIWAKKDSQYK